MWKDKKVKKKRGRDRQEVMSVLALVPYSVNPTGYPGERKTEL